MAITGIEICIGIEDGTNTDTRMEIHIGNRDTTSATSTVVLSRAGALCPFISTLDRTDRADTDTGDERGLEYRSITIPSWAPVSPCRKGICSRPNDQIFPLVL